MFAGASEFNGDFSEWDVSGVINMDHMFQDVRFFRRILCGAAWVNSQASRESMLVGSLGSISQITCSESIVGSFAFSPQSIKELESAVQA